MNATWALNGFTCIAIAACGVAASLSASERTVLGVFCGSSPCGEAIRELLRIPTNGEPDIIEWKLTLSHSGNYDLRCDYGSTVANKPGLAKNAKTLERRGTWTTGKGIKSDPEAITYELNGALSLLQVDSNTLHVLNKDHTLMVGHGGWSYTLNRSDHAEKVVDPALAASQPDLSYQIAPLASGPAVFGVFEGRSPCQGIARELKVAVHGGCNKAKWRVTLYQNPDTGAPTTYKGEGTLFRQGAREGTWTMTRGSAGNSGATVYELAATKTQAPLLLLKGDDNVLFFLDQNRSPLVGHCGFSYTLNRRTTNGR